MASLAYLIERAGVNVDARLLTLLARISGRAHQIKAGSYEVHGGITPWRGRQICAWISSAEPP